MTYFSLHQGTLKTHLFLLTFRIRDVENGGEAQGLTDAAATFNDLRLQVRANPEAVCCSHTEHILIPFSESGKLECRSSH